MKTRCTYALFDLCFLVKAGTECRQAFAALSVEIRFAHTTHSHEACTIALTGNEVHVLSHDARYPTQTNISTSSASTQGPLSVWGWMWGKRQR
jgi:hypothetical protein